MKFYKGSPVKAVSSANPSNGSGSNSNANGNGSTNPNEPGLSGGHQERINYIEKNFSILDLNNFLL